MTGVFCILMMANHFLLGLETDLTKMNQFYLPLDIRMYIFLACEITLDQRPVKQQTKVYLVDKSGPLEPVIECHSALRYRKIS